jgi:hypothetical protein
VILGLSDMETLSITERYGDPASFAYYGQHYQSLTAAKCALCGRDIRNVYTLRPPRGRSVPIGECCFSVFEEVNHETYTRLLAAQVLLDAYEEGTDNDIKVFNARGDKDFQLREWRKLRRQVLSRVRKYRKDSGSDWLPKQLHDLRAEANKKPGKTIRWFESHIPILREGLTAENPPL